MRLLPPLILLFFGFGFIYFLLSLNTPSHPIPALLAAYNVQFPDLVETWADRVAGFALVDGGRSVHVGWMGHNKEKGVLQQYIVPLALNTSQVEAKAVGVREINGTVTHIAFNRQIMPDAGLAMIYRHVDGEHMSYHMDMTILKSEDTSKLACGKTTEGCGEKELFSHRSWELPGNLPLTRASLGSLGKLVASRRYDANMFRVYLFGTDTDESERSGERSEGTGIGGPSIDLSLGRQLLAMELYNPIEGHISVFSVTFQEVDDFYRVSMSIFTWVDGKWEQDEIWKQSYLPVQRSVYSPALGHEVIEAENVDQLFWLGTPVVAASLNSKSVAWVFLGRIFTLDYIGKETSGKSHGYVLDDSRIVDEISHSNLKIRGANLNQDGSVLALVTEVDDMIVFKRSPSSSEREAESSGWWDVESFFSIPHEVAFFFDGALESTPMRGAAPAEEKSSGKGRWELHDVWLNNIDGGAAGRTVIAFSLVDAEQLRLDVQSSSESEQQCYISNYSMLICHSPSLMKY
ncbi:hypothetical protein SpCBS45565_g06725 [Spizellomyces sp. 'palustris']|nr:hypothetical protein SpCBS45565_g06725 [Spizellomyces sp. 'palustris']